jgi:hypothetical protein
MRFTIKGARSALRAARKRRIMLPEKHAIRATRAEEGFFDQQLRGFLEQRGWSNIVVAGLTSRLKREAARWIQRQFLALRFCHRRRKGSVLKTGHELVA